MYDDQPPEWMDTPTPLFILQTFPHYPPNETQFTTGSDHLHFRARTNLYTLAPKLSVPPTQLTAFGGNSFNAAERAISFALS